MNSDADTWLIPGGFPHSEISGSKVGCHLTGAFRRLQRLSSPPIAKASTVCTLSLDHKLQQSIDKKQSVITVRLRQQPPSSSPVRLNHTMYIHALHAISFLDIFRYRQSAFSFYLVKELLAWKNQIPSLFPK